MDLKFKWVSINEAAIQNEYNLIKKHKIETQNCSIFCVHACFTKMVRQYVLQF